jgi:hypothetical protein
MCSTRNQDLNHYKQMEAWSAHAPKGYAPERRSSERFPIELQAELSAGGMRLRGKTANISSGGLLLTCDQDVEVGTLVTVRLHWPIQQRKKQVILVVYGEIIRRDASGLAILHRQHEFEVASLPATSHSRPLSLYRLLEFLVPGFWFPQLDCAVLTSIVSTPT